VLEVFPLLPLVARVTLGVGALSYAGQLNITVVGDRDAVPDLDSFTAGAEANCGHSASLSQPDPGHAGAAAPPPVIHRAELAASPGAPAGTALRPQLHVRPRRSDPLIALRWPFKAVFCADSEGRNAPIFGEPNLRSQQRQIFSRARRCPAAFALLRGSSGDGQRHPAAGGS
jgi:hypothetical protein